MATMVTNNLPGGLWPVMLTPFLENNQVDYDGLEHLTHFYLQHGAKGLFANCLSSEMYQLTDEERLKIIRTVIKVSGNKAPVIATGTLTSNIQHNADFVSKVHDEGVAAVIIITNLFAEMEDSETTFKKNIETLLQKTGNIPLGLYECPVPYKRLLSAELMYWLAGTKRFFYHKDTSCNAEAINKKLEAIKGSPLFLYNANTATALSSLENGARGFSAIGANLYPELYSYLFHEFETQGSSPELKQLNQQLTIMDTVVDLCYPFSAKFFLQKRGIPISTQCRIPYQKPKAENFIKLNTLMQVFQRVSEKLQIDAAGVPVGKA